MLAYCGEELNRAESAHRKDFKDILDKQDSEKRLCSTTYVTKASHSSHASFHSDSLNKVKKVHCTQIFTGRVLTALYYCMYIIHSTGI